MFKADGPFWLLFGELDDDAGAGIYEAFYRADPSKPILFFLNSPGGDALLGLSLAHEIHTHFERLETRAIGNCGSTAVVLLQAGTVRTTNPYTEFYTHNPRALKVEMLPTDAPSFTASLLRNASDWHKFFAKRTKRPAKFWADFLSHDRYFDAQEALRLGLVDRVE